MQRLQDGSWRPLSGPASSGERALGLTVPLDEAFAGIDDEARASCMAKARRIALQREWRRVVADVVEPRLQAAVADPVGLAVLKRLAGSDPGRSIALLANAERVLARLPSRGLPLAL